jgi:SAM-dependent methyltransferase
MTPPGRMLAAHGAPPAPSAQAAWRLLHAKASAPYRHAGHWATHWSRNKLRFDPVFRGLLERGELPPGARVLDIGCGMGLLASLLCACGALLRSGHWPAAWPVRATAMAYTGIDLMPSDVTAARAALAAASAAPGGVADFVCADMRHADFPRCDVVVILDVLHYVDHAAQRAVLERAAAALRAGAAGLPRPGRLLLRVGDAACQPGYAISQWVDRLVTRARGHRAAPTHGRTLAQWQALLRELGFEVRAQPQSQGTPFANVLLVADLAGGHA